MTDKQTSKQRNDPRIPRDRESRTTETRPTDAWIEPSKLPLPDPRDGLVHRWIRVSVRGEPDRTNESRRRREGWEPVNASDYPELYLTTDEGSRYPDGLEVGGLLLCKMPQERVQARTDHYARKAEDQTRSVEHNFFRDQERQMPKFNESESRTEFRKG